MVLRRCSLCDRNFTKAEHYLRHQRSHTKERPYECVTCKKRFSRSDVLFRHSKLHAQPGSDGPGAPSSTPSDRTMQEPPSNESLVTIAEEHVSVQTPFNPPERHFVQQQQQQQQSFGEMHMPQSRHLSMPDISHGPTTYGMSPQQHGSTPQLTPTHMYSGPDFSPHQNYPSSRAIAEASVHNYDPQLVPMEQQPMDNMMHTFAGDSHSQPQDLLQYWLSQADNGFNYTQLPLPELGNDMYHMESTERLGHSQLHRAAISETSEATTETKTTTTTTTSNIPNERFARVESCWLAKSNNTSYLASSLWHEIARSPGPNLFATKESSSSEKSSSRCGIGAETRSRLEAEFGVRASHTIGQNDFSNASNIAFPPPEVLDICLDMYFRRFHALGPFIHIPTFSASSAPLPLLYSMCLLGLSTLESGSGGKYINHSFCILLRKVHNELARIAVTPSAPHERLAVFAAGFLTLSLAALSGDKDRLMQSQMLYSTLIATAQRQGLFSVEDPKIDDMLLDIKEDNSRWLAWAHIESAKRLVVALVTVDWYFATDASTSPLIRPESMQVILPCDDVLFKVDSSQGWTQLRQSGRRLSMPMIRPRTFNLEGALDSVIMLDPAMDALGQYTLLSTVRLCLCDAQHRHFLLSDDWDRHDHLVPWKTFQDDLRGRSLVRTTLALAPVIMGPPKTPGLNSMVLWHNICLSLNVNIQIFELAAGRAGAGPASKALADIAEWTQTPSARRACIHAAQTFKLLSNRKVSETITLSSMSALFCSALVLGLYLFTVPPQLLEPTGSAPTYELLDDVDWTVVGDIGMAERPPENSPSMIFESAHEFDAARAFISKGGPVSMGGVTSVGGYLPARRTFLDFAHVLDGIANWKPRTLSRILHIMSDVLEDSM